MPSLDDAGHRRNTSGARRPSVSAVIPHYGDPSLALRLIADLRARQSAGPVEIIVCDDHSPTPFPDTGGVRVLRRDHNGGFGAAVNSGARAATGDLLLILNSDLRVEPGFVDALVRAATAWQPCVAAPAVTDEAGQPAWTGRHFPTTAHQVVEWLTPLARLRHLRVLHEAVGHDTACRPGVTRPVDWLVGAVLLVPRALFQAAGGFREDFFMNSEEVDLQRRLAEFGVPAVYCGTVHATHTGGGSSDPHQRRRWLVRSRLHYATLWTHAPSLRAALTIACGINLAWNTGRRLAGRPVNPVQSLRFELSLVWGDA